MSWSMEEECSLAGLHRERCRQPEHRPALRRQCLVKAAGVVDAVIWSVKGQLQDRVKHILAHGEGSPHLCRPISVGDAIRLASARTVHARSLQCGHDLRHPDRD
jgi:hypothetical protein